MAAQELDLEEFHRCNDMALVTWLKLKGHAVQAVRMEASTKTCFWYFRNTDRLHDDIDTFHTKAALVEPTEYNKLFARTKREFYDLTD